MSHDLKSGLKSIYLQFGRFRWPESADPADLIKSENFIFFDFLRSILIHFMHCKFHEYWKVVQIYNAEKDDFWWILHTFPSLFIHFTLSKLDDIVLYYLQEMYILISDLCKMYPKSSFSALYICTIFQYSWRVQCWKGRLWIHFDVKIYISCK